MGDEELQLDGRNSVSRGTGMRMPAAFRNKMAGSLQGMSGRASARELPVPSEAPEASAAPPHSPTKKAPSPPTQKKSKPSVYSQVQLQLQEAHGQELSMHHPEEAEVRVAIDQALFEVKRKTAVGPLKASDNGYIEIDEGPQPTKAQYEKPVGQVAEPHGGYIEAEASAKPQYQQAPFIGSGQHKHNKLRQRSSRGRSHEDPSTPRSAHHDGLPARPYEDVDDELGPYLANGGAAGDIQTINGAKVVNYAHLNKEGGGDQPPAYRTVAGQLTAPGEQGHYQVPASGPYERPAIITVDQVDPRFMADAHIAAQVEGAVKTYVKGRTLQEIPPEEIAHMLSSLDASRLTVHQRFTDRLPVAGRQYFIPADSERRRITSVIPTYNEPCVALRRTLMSMHTQLENLKEIGFDFYAVIIVDGWSMASDTMKTYLKKIFPASAALTALGVNPWWEDLENPGPPVETFVIQNVHPRTWRAIGVEFEPDIMPKSRLHLQLMIKRDNRRKHNTLEWFLSGFAEEYMGEYAFTTDCGTLYEKNTISELAKHLDTFPRCAGATGRQRVMTAQQQGELDEDWYSAWMRAVQGYEYEATYASYVGAFSMCGMLPVIPGPCGLFRMEYMRGSGNQFFFDIVKQDPDTAGLLLGNGLLAEDRFLSYGAVLTTGRPTITEFVPESTFYFEAETDLKTFVQQRRRWNNGTLACFVWLMRNSRIIRQSAHGMFFKLFCQFLVIWQVLWLLISLIAPALFVTLIRLGLRHTFPRNESLNSFWADLICIGYLVFYLFFIKTHCKEKFVAWTFHAFTLIHCFAVLFIIGTFAHSATKKRDDVFNLTLWVFAAYQGGPIALSLLISPRSAIFLAKSFIPFLLFLPTQQLLFWTYALSRTFDLTWGNRPTLHKLAEDKRGQVTELMKERSHTVIALIATTNVLLSLLLMQIVILDKTQWIVWLLVSLMVFAGVQMVLSFMFAFEFHIVRRIRRLFAHFRVQRERKEKIKAAKEAGSARPLFGDISYGHNTLEWDGTGEKYTPQQKKQVKRHRRDKGKN